MIYYNSHLNAQIFRFCCVLFYSIILSLWLLLLTLLHILSTCRSTMTSGNKKNCVKLFCYVIPNIFLWLNVIFAGDKNQSKDFRLIVFFAVLCVLCYVTSTNTLMENLSDVTNEKWHIWFSTLGKSDSTFFSSLDFCGFSSFLS